MFIVEAVLKLQKKLIISHLLGSDPALMGLLFDPIDSTCLRDKPDALIFDAWELNAEQRILVLTAPDIWGAKGNVFVWELLKGLNDYNLSRFIGCLQKWRDLDSNAVRPEKIQGRFQV